MKLYMPTKVFLERDCVLKHSEELITLGKHAMIVTVVLLVVLVQLFQTIGMKLSVRLDKRK